MSRLRAAFHRSGACVLALMASCDGPSRVTQVVAVIDGDLSLDRVHVRVLDREATQPGSERDFLIGRTDVPGKHTLPLTFGIVPEGGDLWQTFRVVATGYRGTEALVQQQVIASFRPDETLLLELFLMSACVSEFCDSTPAAPGNMTCSVTTGSCGLIAQNELLPQADRDTALAGYRNRLPPAPSTAPASDPEPPDVVACAACTLREAYPCAQLTPEEYTCRGQFADWRMPDTLPSAKFVPSYAYPATGVVRDRVTGLAWQREVTPSYSGCPDASMPAPGGCSLEHAKAYCAQLTLGGFSWRLPSMIELHSIFDGSAGAPFIDGEAFPSTPPDAFWTVSPVLPLSGEVHKLSFGAGASGAFVRCVNDSDIKIRDIPEWRYGSEFSADYYDIIDERTELRWMRNLEGKVYGWQEAQDVCARAGDGYRLPSLNELMSLVDFTATAPPAIDTVRFPDTPAERFWSASTSSGDPASAWAVDFATSRHVAVARTEALWVRCVR